jgi:iron complex outermembrane receptor protein
LPVDTLLGSAKPPSPFSEDPAMLHPLRPDARLTLIAAACFCVCGAAAQTPDAVTAEPSATPATASIGRVVVSSKKETAMPATLETVSAAQIDESINTVTAAGTLQYLPSTHVRERYIGDRNGILVMRVNSSVASAQTTVYADGLLLSNFLNNSFATAPRWGMVSPEEIESIDVIYGPYSAQFPGNSAGGVVRMTTRMPTRFEAHAKVDLFGERYKEYGTDANFNGSHASVSLGNKVGDWAYWLSLDHLDNKSHPQTFGNTTAKTGAAAAAGTFTDVSGSRVYRDTDTSGNPRIIVSSTGIDHTVQDMAKLKLSYRVSPTLNASYTLGIWQNKSEGSVDSYLRDANGNTVFNAGATYANPFKYVRIDGKDYTVSAAVPSQSDGEHWMHGLTLRSSTGGAWDFELVASLYDQQKDISRSAAPTNGRDNGSGSTVPGGQVTFADGTGWQNIDLRGTWRLGGGHTLNAGLHHDRYELASVTWGTATAPIGNWLTSTTGTKSTQSAGKTQTEALYVQDEWRVAPELTLSGGVRQESWQAFDGSNYSDAFTLANTKNSANPKTLLYANRKQSNLSPKLHAAWQAAPDLTLRASLGKGVRYPTVSEMFQTFNGPNGIKTNDPNLKPEQVNSMELVAQKQWADGMLRASYFFEDKRDALISQTDTTVTPNLSSIQNVDQVRTGGVELAFARRNFLTHGLDINGSVTYTHSLITKDTRNPLLEGTAQPRIPDWRATLVAVYRASDALSYSLSYRFSGRQHNALFNTTTKAYNDINPDVYGAVSHYSVFDAKVLYRINPQWTGSLGINNIGNFKYYVNPNPYPQRTLFASVKFDL